VFSNLHEKASSADVKCPYKNTNFKRGRERKTTNIRRFPGPPWEKEKEKCLWNSTQMLQGSWGSCKIILIVLKVISVELVESSPRIKGTSGKNTNPCRGDRMPHLRSFPRHYTHTNSSGKESKGLTICSEPISYVLVQVARVYKG
jgi:hypothetical protein